MSKQTDRLYQVIQHSNLTYIELEKKTGIAKSSIQRYATGRTNKIPVDAIKLIADATDSSAAWIMGWEEKTPNKSDTLTNTEKALLDNYRKLNTVGKAKADNYLDDLLESPKYRKENETIDVPYAAKKTPKFPEIKTKPKTT